MGGVGARGVRMNHAAVAGETLHFVVGQTLQKQVFGSRSSKLVAEVTVMNANAAMLLERKQFLFPLLPESSDAACTALHDDSLGDDDILKTQKTYEDVDLSCRATIGCILKAIRARVEALVQQCRDEERTAEERDAQLRDFDNMLGEHDDLADLWWKFGKYIGPSKCTRDSLWQDKMFWGWAGEILSEFRARSKSESIWCVK